MQSAGTTEIESAPEVETKTPVAETDVQDPDWKKFLTPPKDPLTLNDLQIVSAIITMSSKAGVFSPVDFQPVGVLFTKINTYINHMKAKEMEAATAAASKLQSIEEQEAAESTAEDAN